MGCILLLIVIAIFYKYGVWAGLLSVLLVLFLDSAYKSLKQEYPHFFLWKNSKPQPESHQHKNYVEDSYDSDAYFSHATYRALFGLLAKVATASGRVRESQANYLKKMIATLFSDIDKEFIRSAFNEARDNNVNYKIYANQLDSLITNLNDKQVILSILCELVATTPPIHPKALEIIYYTEHIFGFNGFAHFFFGFNHQQHHEQQAQRPSQDQMRLYYDILGVSPSATNDEVKKAYRKCCMSSHPDRLGAHASPALKERATQEMHRINEAYQVISKARHI